MKRILFATGNPNKLREASAILPMEVEQLAIDLPEIQSLDLQEILTAKLQAAYEECGQPVMVEDVSAELEALNGFPGPFIKFAEKTMGKAGLYELLKGHENKRAHMKAMVGFHDGSAMHFFTGQIDGIITAPREGEGFGFDFVFVPDGYDKTMSELGFEIKNTISHRYLALKNLADFLS